MFESCLREYIIYLKSFYFFLTLLYYFSYHLSDQLYNLTYLLIRFLLYFLISYKVQKMFTYIFVLSINTLIFGSNIWPLKALIANFWFTTSDPTYNLTFDPISHLLASWTFNLVSGSTFDPTSDLQSLICNFWPDFWFAFCLTSNLTSNLQSWFATLICNLYLQLWFIILTCNSNLWLWPMALTYNFNL